MFRFPWYEMHEILLQLCTFQHRNVVPVHHSKFGRVQGTWRLDSHEGIVGLVNIRSEEKPRAIGSHLVCNCDSIVQHFEASSEEGLMSVVAILLGVVPASFEMMIRCFVSRC